MSAPYCTLESYIGDSVVPVVPSREWFATVLHRQLAKLSRSRMSSFGECLPALSGAAIFNVKEFTDLARPDFGLTASRVCDGKSRQS